MCIVDTLILTLAITVVLLAEYKYSGRFMESLRFIQILRFFHIDRQLISWCLLKKFIERSSFELISIYYITSFVFALMACLVFTLESNETHGGMVPNSGKLHVSRNKSFLKIYFRECNIFKLWRSLLVFGHFNFYNWVGFNRMCLRNIWILRYGDIVPSAAMTKILVCIFSYVGLCMFGAASTLAGVGLSLMLDHRNKEQKKTKMLNLAATTIQVWYRYHLVTNEQTFNNIPIYR